MRRLTQQFRVTQKILMTSIDHYFQFYYELRAQQTFSSFYGIFCVRPFKRQITLFTNKFASWKLSSTTHQGSVQNGKQEKEAKTKRENRRESLLSWKILMTTMPHLIINYHFNTIDTKRMQQTWICFRCLLSVGLMRHAMKFCFH